MHSIACSRRALTHSSTAAFPLPLQEAAALHSAVVAEKAALEATLQQVRNASKAALLAENAVLKSSLQDAEAKEAKAHVYANRLKDRLGEATRTISCRDATVQELQEAVKAKDKVIDAKQQEVNLALKAKIASDEKVTEMNRLLANAKASVKKEQEAVQQIKRRMFELVQERDRAVADASQQQGAALQQQYAELLAKHNKLVAQHHELQDQCCNMDSQLLDVHRAKTALAKEKEELLRLISNTQGAWGTF